MLGGIIIIKVPCMIMRGGTSKGIFFKESTLPKNLLERNKIIIRIMGSGEPSQIDGLGGAQTHTSKIMIVKKSTKDGIDVEYIFGQVGIERPFIDYTGNCGNLTSAVGAFAIESEITKPEKPKKVVRMLNINTNKRVDIAIECDDNGIIYDGSYKIDGVKHFGSCVEAIWHNPSGAITGSLLPTGNVIDILHIGNKQYNVSIVDSGNLCIFINAIDVGLEGTEQPSQISLKVLNILEKIRSKGAEMVGLVKNAEEATAKAPHLPFIAIVAPPIDYIDFNDNKIEKNKYIVLSRLFSMQKMHHAFPITGAISLSSAAKIKGTVVNEVLTNSGQETIIIGHPKGLMDLKVSLSNNNYINFVSVGRTVRLLMSGFAYL